MQVAIVLYNGMTASFAHDFAYWFGYLLVSKDNGGHFVKVPLERHEADLLFRDLISEINQTPGVAHFAWMFVRLGWFFVAYAGLKRQGKRPYADIVPLIIGSLLCCLTIMTFPSIIICLLLFAYGIFWLILLAQVIKFSEKTR